MNHARSIRLVRLAAAAFVLLFAAACTPAPAKEAAGDVIHATGTVEFNADRMARILSPVAGQVQNLRLNVGDDVRQGETLFSLSSREVAAAVADHLEIGRASCRERVWR